MNKNFIYYVFNVINIYFSIYKLRGNFYFVKKQNNFFIKLNLNLNNSI